MSSAAVLRTSAPGGGGVDQCRVVPFNEGTGFVLAFSFIRNRFQLGSIFLPDICKDGRIFILKMSLAYYQP